jgi:enoyl-CoA hydratase/carnithine racemase
VLRGGQVAGGAADVEVRRARRSRDAAVRLAYVTELFVTCFASDDKREGIAAFLEKRPAAFTGR